MLATVEAASTQSSRQHSRQVGGCFLVPQVPTYLLERKLQMAQEYEARLAAKAAAAIPPGGTRAAAATVCVAEPWRAVSEAEDRQHHHQQQHVLYGVAQPCVLPLQKFTHKGRCP